MINRRLIALLGSICLIVILVALPFLAACATGGVTGTEPKPETTEVTATAPKPETTEVTATALKSETTTEVLPQSITPVVILQGSDYEMGYQYGQQAGQWIAMRKKTTLITEDILHELKVAQWYLKEYAPEVIDQLKGIADGCTDAGYEMSYINVLMLNARLTAPSPPYNYPPGAEDEELPPSGCSQFAAWGSATTDGSLICANSADAPFTYNVAIVAFPDEGNNFMAIVSAGGLVGAHPGLNSEGLFLGQSGGFAVKDDYGIHYYALLQHLLRFANSASEAKEMLIPWKIRSAQNYLFADVSGDIFVGEVSSFFKNFREPGDFGEDDFIYCTNNFFTEEGRDAIQGEKFIEHAGWVGGGSSICSIPRNKGLWTMFDRYHGKVDLDFVKMIWRFPGNPPPCSIPCDDDCKKAYYDTKGEGWDVKVLNLQNWWTAIVLPDKRLMYVCTGPAASVAYPFSPGGDYYQIAGTHTFYELVLASSPSKVIKAAKSAAKDYIAEAYQELMWLNFTDTGYAALNELFSEANAEYYEGIYWTHEAALADGNEALSCYAKAATSFTKSQAHAKQVFNALVPPPDDPKDLGLKPYKETAWLGK